MTLFNYPVGATPLDANEIDGLKLKHITTQAELDRWEQENIQDAIAWLERRHKSEILNEEFVCQLHEKMFGKVWIWAGQFRKSNKNIGVDWLNIPVELRQLLGNTKYWIENKVFVPDEIAYRFHHKLVLIHLFPNGNGRHSRLFTDVLLTEMKQEPFTWGSKNLVKANSTRTEYIQALKAADANNYTPLNTFVRS